MTRNTDGRAVVTDEMRKALRGWQDKTGFGITAIFRHAEIHNLFETSKSLSAAAFQGILMGKTKTAVRADYDAVIAAYESLTPDMWGKAHVLSCQKVRVPVSDAFKRRLTAVLDRSSMSRARLLKLHGAPKDLTNVKLGLILRRENTTILKTHLDFLERLIAERQAQ